MRQIILLLLFFYTTVAFSQLTVDSIVIEPSTIPHFVQDTNQITDIIEMDIEIKNGDTTKNETIVKYKVDNIGRIITTYSTGRSKYDGPYAFYSYDKYPEIYCTSEPNTLEWFNVFKCNESGQLIEFTSYQKLEKDNLYWKTYNSKYKYTSRNKLELKQLNSLQLDYSISFLYDDKSRLKKYTFSQYFETKKDSTKEEVNYIINDSSYTIYSEKADSESTITYSNTIFYDANYKVTSEKESKLVKLKSGKEYYMLNIHTFYSYDQMGRQTEIKTVFIPDRDSIDLITIKKYIYNTDKKVNLNQLNVENGS